MNHKHNEFIDEMMVVFSGKKDVPVEQVPTQTEPEYIANDVFTNATNDLLKNFNVVPTGVCPEPMTHVMTIDDQTPSEVSDDNSVDDVNEPGDDQIVFDLVDGKLKIKFGSTELHLSGNAIKKLKDYLNDEYKDSEDSEDTDDDDENIEEGWAYEEKLPRGTKLCPKGHPLKIEHNNGYCKVCRKNWVIEV